MVRFVIGIKVAFRSGSRTIRGSEGGLPDQYDTGLDSLRGFVELSRTYIGTAE